MAETFEQLRKEAQGVEHELEQRIAEYARIDTDGGHAGPADEEAGVSPERACAAKITSLLQQLNEYTDRMARLVAAAPSRVTTGVVQRNRELCHDFMTTFRKQAANHKQRRDAAALFGRDRNASETGGSDEPSAMDMLLRERGSLSNSTSSVDSILSIAAGVRDGLARQRGSLQASHGGLGSIAAVMPGAQQLIAAIQQRRMFNDRVSAGVVGVVIFFFLYWFVLRHL